MCVNYKPMINQSTESSLIDRCCRLARLVGSGRPNRRRGHLASASTLAIMVFDWHISPPVVVFEWHVLTQKSSEVMHVCNYCRSSDIAGFRFRGGDRLLSCVLWPESGEQAFRQFIRRPAVWRQYGNEKVLNRAFLCTGTTLCYTTDLWRTNIQVLCT